MFHIVLAIASRFLYFGNALQGFARGIFSLRNLGIISSHLIPALSPPPPISLLDAPVPFLVLPEEIIPPYSSGGIIALERIERQPPSFASPIPSYQSSLMIVSSSQLPVLLPLFIIMLAIISGFVLLLPEIMDFFTNVVKSRNISKFAKSKFFSSLLLAGVLLSWAIASPAIAYFFIFAWVMSIVVFQDQGSNIIITILQRCGLLAVQDTRTPPLLNAIYEQITRGAAGYDDLIDCSDIVCDYAEDQVNTDGSLRYTDLGHDETPEKYSPRIQNIYTQFVDSQNCLREQLELSRVHQQELHADLLAAEHERERLVSTFGDSDKKRQGAKACCEEAEAIVSKLRADLTAAMDHLDRQTEVASSKDHIIQSVTEESQVARVRLKYAQDKITQLYTKLQQERDRRLCKKKELLDELVRIQDCHESEIRRLKQELLDEQVRVQDCHESEIRRLKQELLDEQVRAQDCHESEIRRLKQELLDELVRVQDCHESEMSRLKQEAQDAQEQLDTLRGAMSQLRVDGGSPLDHDHLARYRQPTTRPYNSCQPPLPPERIHDTGTLPISPVTNVDSSLCSTKSSSCSPSRDQEDSSTCKDQKSEVAQDHRAALKKLFGWMRQEEYESAQDAVKLNSEQREQESRLQDELAVTKEQLCVAEEEFLTVRRDLDQSRETLQEVKNYIAFFQHEREMCKAMLRESQDARRSSITDLAEVLGLLRVSQAESEESQIRCSQATFLCAALQERVTELEDKVKKLNYSEMTPLYADFESRSCCRAGTGTDTAPFDVEAVTHDLKFQDSDSIYMTIPPLLPRILDFSLPTSPSSSTSFSSPYLSHQGCSVISPTCTDTHSHSFCPTDTDAHSISCNTDTDSFLLELSLALKSCDKINHHYGAGLRNDQQDVQQSANPESTNSSRLVPLSSPSSEGVSRLPSPLYRTNLSERNSIGSMDWPPIGSVLSPGRGNVWQDREEDIETEEGTDDPILYDQDSLSPSQGFEPVLKRGPVAPDPTPGSPPILNFSYRKEGKHSSGQDRCSVTNASPTPSRYRDVPIRSPHHSLPSPSKSPPPRFLGLLDPVSIDSISDGTVQLRNARRRRSHRRNSSFGTNISHVHDILVPKLDYDLPADFFPSFNHTAPKRQVVGMDEFAYLIPLDCLTSTPVAPRKRTLRKGLLGSGGGGVDLAGINSSPPMITPPRKTRMFPRMIDNSPRPRVRPDPRPQERKTSPNVKGKGKERMPVQAEAFEFFGSEFD